MVLSILKFMQRSFDEHIKIHHFPGSITVGMPNKLKGSIKSLIQKKFGEKFLDDANYIVMATPRDIPFDKRTKNKFSILAANVFGLEEIKEFEIREFGVKDDNVNESDEEEEENTNDEKQTQDAEPKDIPDLPEVKGDSATPKYLMLKVTTKTI